jgi:putative tryptophan/tyrosine transport system substrate-binding protein
MRRRDFLIGTGLSAAALPLSPRALAADAMKRVAILMGVVEDKVGQNRVAAFQLGLRDLGWEEGRNVRYEIRWGAGDAARTRDYANELVALNPDLILATNTPTARALKQTTGTVPIIFTGLADPVADGIVASHASPAGNFTGFVSFSAAIAGKWLQLLKEVAPSSTRIAVLYNPDTAPYAIFYPVMEAIAPSLGMTLIRSPVRDKETIESAIKELSAASDGALAIMPDVFMLLHARTIFDLAIRHRLPSVSPLRQFVAAGSLISYGSNFDKLFRQAASYADRILHGEKPNKLPVQEPTEYELIVNLKTAKAIGLTMPETLLGRADEVIE